jgi:hypothetical protein
VKIALIDILFTDAENGLHPMMVCRSSSTLTVGREYTFFKSTFFVISNAKG